MGEEYLKQLAAEDYEAAIGEAGERLRFQVDFAQSVLKSLLIVNGGAIVSLLTLIGNSDASFSKRDIWWSFFWFAGGVATALAAYFGAFLSQYFFLQSTTHEAWNAQLASKAIKPRYDPKAPLRFGNRALWVAFCFAIFSLMQFVTGSFVALGGIL